MSSQPKALVLNAPGINCNLETGFAIEQAGGIADQVHITQLESGDKRLDDYQMLVLSGGFSHGDDIASGRILGLELRQRLPEELNTFVAAGKAVLGICNGFQVLVESGLLPYGRIDDFEDKSPGTSLTTNATKNFDCRWGKLFIPPSVCQFIPDSWESSVVELPSAHAEGHFRHDYLDELQENGQIVFQYCDEAGLPTTDFPANPNGSVAGITGICDASGVVLGMMPHPERAVNPWQHPNWRRGEGQNPFGVVLFNGLVDYASEL